MDIEQKLKGLASKSPKIKLYQPATFNLVLRSENMIIGGKIAPELKEFFRISNGAGFLDYGLTGCKNHKILDIAENTLDIWYVNNGMAGDFVGFISTSKGENFGYLMGVQSDTGSYPVAYLREILDEGLIVIASSIALFFENFLSKLEETVSTAPNSLYISDEEWPCNLNEWFQKDPELVELYKSGKLKKYYENDAELNAYIENMIKNR